MCGITGFFNLQSNTKEWYDKTLKDMTSSIIHRGPDAQGYWYDENHGIGLGHVRLSILDLSEAGSQPMRSHCGRYIFVYNGEVYNYQETQKELESEFGSIDWRGTSDTEVILYAFSKWGAKKTLEKCNGMFAFALWDKHKQELTIGRDRMGQKPLFYGYVGNDFVFGSELKSLKKYSEWKGDICTDTLDVYLRMGYVPTPYSIYKDIHKLMPSTFLVIAKDHLVKRDCGSPIEYWSLKRAYEQGIHSKSLDEDLKRVEELLTDSVKKRMIADVPLGAFLSGGFDSSLIVALMQKESAKKVNTFSIGFNDNNFNEAVYAKEISKILGTNHNELYVSPNQVLDLFPKMTEIYDEPYADPSQFPTYIVSKLARDKVTVAISGDAGDELFGGYERYINFPKRWQKSKFIPNALAKLFINSLDNSSLIYKNSFIKNINRYGHLFSTNDRHKYYFEQISLMSNTSSLLKKKCNSRTFFNDENLKVYHDSFEEEMMYIDLRTFVLDDILVKVDRASMANSLEVRNPYLDHRLIEYAARVPVSRKIRDNKTKWLTRQILYRYLPKELMDRPKSGFMIPISSWLKNEFRDMAYDLLNEDKLNSQGIFDANKVNLLLDLHNSGGKVHGHLIWNLIAFQDWLDNE
tara:strand:- start:143 stop:2044 length:1902 start_codon:yes stop_codon:yes gene_type:complete